MDQVTFSWDDRKARANLGKHSVSFDEAATVFSDESARLIHDPASSGSEDRLVLVGFGSKLRLLVVCHTYRHDDREIRIVSARKATRHERQQYGSFL